MTPFTLDKIETKQKINYGSAILYYVCLACAALVISIFIIHSFIHSLSESYSNRSFHFHTTAKIKLASENKIRTYRGPCARDTPPHSSFINPEVSFWYISSSSSSSYLFHFLFIDSISHHLQSFFR